MGVRLQSWYEAPHSSLCWWGEDRWSIGWLEVVCDIVLPIILPTFWRFEEVGSKIYLSLTQSDYLWA
jgi:hypothetical protein